MEKNLLLEILVMIQLSREYLPVEMGDLRI
jgi:hypothetical protein